MWNQTYGGGVARSLVETSDGGFAVVGGTLLVKTDAYGNMEWNKTYEGLGYDIANSLVATSDGGYALAGITAPSSASAEGYDFWLVKTDAFGNVEWNKTIGGESRDEAESLVATSDGGYALAGYTSSFGASDGDFWLVKTDAFGNVEWNKTIGGASLDWAYALVETSDGGYALAGYTHSFGDEGANFWLVKTDAFGNMEWNEAYGGMGYDMAHALIETSDGGYAIAGNTDSFGSWGTLVKTPEGGYTVVDGGGGELDIWLIKTDATGNVQWERRYGRQYNDGSSALVETSDGGYALSGYTQTVSRVDRNSDLWLIKTGPGGNMEWNKTIGGEKNDEAYSLVETSDGGFALAGYTHSFGVEGTNFWLVKTDENGTIPEFPSWTIIPLFLVTTLVVATYRKKLTKAEKSDITF